MMRRPTFRAGPTTGIWAGLPAFVALVLLAAHLAQAGVAALAIDPTSPMTLYAGTTFPDAPPIGVHKSTDGGRTWNPTGLADIDVSSLAIDPTAPMTLYAGTIAGVHKSIDGGRGWNPSGLDGFYIYRLVIDPTTTPLTIYAYALSILGSSLLTSTDGGGTWNEAHGSGPADPPVPAIAYSRTPGGGVSKSTDGGVTWLARNAGLADANVLALAVDPSTPTTLYAGTKSGGLFKSTDGACTWSPSGLSNPTGGQRALPVCQTGPDGVGIACRLDLLVLVVHALRPPEGNRRDDKLLACATAARDRVTEAETLASTNERKASARLRRAIHKVAVFRHVTHRVMRKPDAFWTMFSMADGVLTDLRALQTLGAAQAACR